MATATSTSTIRGLPRPLARAMEAYSDRLDVEAVRDAYELARAAHPGEQEAFIALMEEGRAFFGDE